LVYDRVGEVPPSDLAAPETRRWEGKAWRIVHPTIEHLHGPEEVAYGMEELVVLCLVRDGRPYVRSFVEHYRSLGAKHLVFLDNGSTDGTVEALKRYDNVTVLRTRLPFKEHQGPMKRYLVSRFGRGRWSLYADIDELFDYPYSDVVSLGSFLGYLNRNSYTAVVAQMLDMFPEEPLSDTAVDPDEPLKERHRFYDLSNLKKRSITEHRRCPPSNTYGSDDIPALAGGIRWTVFGVSTFLTKHPLVFLDDRLVPLSGPHWVSNAKVADVTCVLQHYKFLGGHLRVQAAQGTGARRKKRNNKGADRYRRYSEVLERTSNLSVRTDASKELNSVNDLVGTRFVSVSRRYMRFVGSEERSSGYRRSAQGGSERLFEAFFRSKEEIKALSEELEAMRRQNRRLRRSEEELERFVERFESTSAEARRAEEDLKLLLSRLASSPLGWVFGLNRNFRELERRYLRKDG
jgi:hypothetical protein